MATATAARPMTADEFYEWANRPENVGRRFELDHGEVVETSRPGERHGAVCGMLAWVLVSYTIARRSGYVLSNDAGLIVATAPDTVRGPDVMLFLEPTAFAGLRVGWTGRVPTLVAEVVSPTDRPGEVDRRVAQYLARPIPLVWVVDPDARTVTAHRPGHGPVVLTAADDLTGDGVLPDFRCRVADFFTLPGETPAAPAAGPDA